MEPIKELDIQCKHILKVISSYGGSLGGQEQQLTVILDVVDVENILSQLVAQYGVQEIKQFLDD